MKLTAVAERAGKWWAVEVPEIPGLFTQAKRLDHIEEMVKDAAALLTGKPEDSFAVEVTVDTSNPQLNDLIHDAKAKAREAARLQAEASEQSRQAASKLATEGLTVREIGEVLELSFQRAHQLLGAGRNNPDTEITKGITNRRSGKTSATKSRGTAKSASKSRSKA
ncbi:type II toxin-antitoxin system HicB family antitoxin [Pseudarthrobacter scleromae]|uniref:Transcriptional regulator n=1 Tax=Pseudarthrobacter scleromae TaxID=158897 RepID=A0ABQ2CGK1_9MICC|nr:type II toxin-antitoxin system HicB family antitoxin [Pseudarthrobacter scleromae]GGI86702.1 hypothetical protein GCM10007175_24870 [Pseudarthrobacter scleromae]